MRLGLILLAMALLVAACGDTSNQAHASPSPGVFGTATLSDTGCDFAMPQQVPIGVQMFKVVNHATFDGRFMLVRIHDGHTFQELIYPDNALPPQKPDWVTDVGLIDVAKGHSDLFTTSIPDKGTYGFPCGYSGRTGKVTALGKDPPAG